MDKKTIPLVGAAIGAVAVAAKAAIKARDASPVTAQVEIGRPSEDVYEYATDPSRFTEWQKDVVSVGTGPEGTAFTGGRFTTVRRIGPLQRPMTMEVTEIEQPVRWGYHGIGGPVTAEVTLTVEPLDGDARSRVTAVIGLKGHGLGKVLVPLVRPRLAKQVPQSYKNLKETLEASA